MEKFIVRDTMGNIDVNASVLQFEIAVESLDHEEYVLNTEVKTAVNTILEMVEIKLPLKNLVGMCLVKLSVSTEEYATKQKQVESFIKSHTGEPGAAGAAGGTALCWRRKGTRWNYYLNTMGYVPEGTKEAEEVVEAA